MVTPASIPVGLAGASLSRLGVELSTSSSEDVGELADGARDVRDDLDAITKRKADLLHACRSNDASAIATCIRELEEAANKIQVGTGEQALQALSGDWDLVYASDDPTRSSPFFWAFQRAFPDSSHQIFDITDNIPSQLKQVGPAQQAVSYDPVSQTGRLVSRVKVTALGGAASSVMTTRASITGRDGGDDLTLAVETTKPEQSSVLTALLGPLGATVNENLPAFPSGAALEQVAPGSSKVMLLTTFCDEGLRISKNKDKPEQQFYVWRRREFASYEYL